MISSNTNLHSLQTVKEGICRSVEELTLVDLYEIYQQIRNLPHVQTDAGYLFDLDESYWTDEQLRSLWDTILERKKRIRDVMNAEQVRSDVVELMQPEKIASEKDNARFCFLENGTRAEIVRNGNLLDAKQKRPARPPQQQHQHRQGGGENENDGGGSDWDSPKRLKRAPQTTRGPIFKKKKTTAAAASSSSANKKSIAAFKEIVSPQQEEFGSVFEDADFETMDDSIMDDSMDPYDTDDSYDGLF